jgi:hypothetical protein
MGLAAVVLSAIYGGTIVSCILVGIGVYAVLSQDIRRRSPIFARLADR